MVLEFTSLKFKYLTMTQQKLHCYFILVEFARSFSILTLRTFARKVKEKTVKFSGALLVVVVVTQQRTFFMVKRTRKKL